MSILVFTDQEVIDAIRGSKTHKEVIKKLGMVPNGNKFNKTVLNKVNKLNINTSHLTIPPRTISAESRIKMSKSKCEWISKNKNKHNWSLYRNKETKPESLFKDALLENNISAFQYYCPPENDRAFELDFAIPELKIAFEINGNQHYNKDGTLSEYYQNRHNYFVEKGWVIHEIHYLECFNQQSIKNIISNYFFDSSTPSEVINYRLVKSQENKNNTQGKPRSINKRPSKCELEKLICAMSNADICKIYEVSNTTVSRWRKHYNLQKPRIKKKEIINSKQKILIKHPTKEELEKIIWEIPTTQVGKLYGVSDSAIGKWCKKHEITKPGRGYWEKLYHRQL